MLAIEELREQLRYDAETGLFHWQVSRNGVTRGARAGRVIRGYVHIRLNWRQYAAHRLAWAHHYGEWPEGEVDHVNRIRSDNRIANLRLATKQENAMNRSVQARNTSGVTGVYWSKAEQKWRARIRVGGRSIGLGYWHSFEDAAQARKNAEIKYFGEFAPK